MVLEMKTSIDYTKATEEAETKSRIRQEKFYSGKLSRHELLHPVRGLAEASHRRYLSMLLERFIFCTTAAEVNPPDERRLDGITGCDLDIDVRHKVGPLCNKLVHFYILSSAERRFGLATGFRLALGNFIHRKRFRPYRSDIDHDRFLTAFICPTDIECSGIIRPASWVIDALADINEKVCEFAYS
ncbi:hypothetical protein LA080_009067 [Diaporthe eres]|nr:hypothetical protein LA080_009067 [Diaporthe eres]